jgi:hypothetical protein
MDLTAKEKEALRALLAEIRQVGEDFTEVYLNRMLQLVAERRLRVFTSAIAGGETLLAGFAQGVALLDEPQQLATTPVLGKENLPKDFPAENYDLKVECFGWAAERCLGTAYTPQAQAGLRKLGLMRRAAVMPGRAGGAARES